jgi:hypothetical protein
MKSAIISLTFVLRIFNGFTQDSSDTIYPKSDCLWYVVLTPLKTIRNHKTKEYKEHYIFQVSHKFIYVINKNYNIKYTMEITKIVDFEDHIELTAKQYGNEKNEIIFSVPLKEGMVFNFQKGKVIEPFSSYEIKVYTENDL